MKSKVLHAIAGMLLTAGIALAPSLAGATNSIGKVEGFSIEQRDDGRPLLLLAITGQPRVTCATTAYANYIVDLGNVWGRAVYAEVLAAHLAERDIGVDGKGTCVTDPRGEDVRHVDSYLGR